MFKTYVFDPAIWYHDANSRGSQFSFFLSCIGTVLDRVHRWQWLHRKKKSSCSITVMLLRIMKSFNISSAVCCWSGKSSWSILFWNTISSKAPMELNTESVIRTLLINFSKKLWNNVLHASLMGTRKRIHQWFYVRLHLEDQQPVRKLPLLYWVVVL